MQGIGPSRLARSETAETVKRESLALVAVRSLTGIKVAAALSEVLRQRRAPQAITVDNGGEFVSRAMG